MLPLARQWGRQALAHGLETLHVARIHDRALLKLALPDSAAARKALVLRAGVFFAEAISPIEETHRSAREIHTQVERLTEKLRHRSEDLAASNRQLRQEITQRKQVEGSLRTSERHYGQLLEQSRRMQEQLRLLSRQLLSAQEEERKKISRELHDVIAQTLTSINVRLAALKTKAALNTKGLARTIADTQRMVEHSVDLVHRFARELRPAALDDLGLIPALRTFMKHFTTETGIRVSLSAFPEIEQVNGNARTALYRVAQEALTNVARHAGASRAEVDIQQQNGAIHMTISDNGKGFQPERVLRSSKGNRLGLLGMRERLEMVGGTFTVVSSVGKGSTVRAQIPGRTAAPRGGGRTRPVTSKL